MGTRDAASSNMDTLKPGDHLCFLYDNDDEHLAVLSSFLQQGLRGKEKVVYIYDRRRPEALMETLAACPEGKALAGGGESPLFLGAESTYLAGGGFDPDVMIAWLAEEARKAVSEGYTALRATGEMSWALGGSPGSERLIEYERKLNAYSCDSQCILLCQYDRRAFDPLTLLGILNAHPRVILGTELLDNYYHVEEEEFMVEDYPKVALEKYLGSLRAFHAHIRSVLGFGEAADRALIDYPEQTVPANMLEAYFSRSMAILSRTASRFVEAQLEEDLWRLIGEELAHIVGESFIIVNAYEDGTGEARPRAIVGDQEAIVRAAAMLGWDPLDMYFEVAEEVKRRFQRGELVRFEGGFSEIATPFIPGWVWEDWRKSFGLREVYGIAFANAGEMLGGAVIVTAGEARHINKPLTEVYAHLAAIAIQRRRAEGRLRESEQRYRTLITAAYDAIISCDGEGVIISWNEGAKNIFGYEEEEVLGKSIRMLIPEEKRESYAARLREDALGGQDSVLERLTEAYGLRKDGTVLPLELSAAAWVGEEGPCYTGVIRDVTKRKAMEEALRDSEERYRELFENTGEGIAVVDEKERVLFANPTAHEIFGVRRGELVGHDLREFTDDKGYATLREQTEVRKRKVRSTYEVDIIRADGKRRTILVTATPRLDEHGRFAGSFGVFSDITERKMMEKELEGFAHTVSHDLRGSLTTIEGFSQVAVQAIGEGHDELAADYLEQVIRVSRRMDDHIDSLLEYVNAGSPEGRAEKTSVAEVISGILDDLQVMIAEKGVEVSRPQQAPMVIVDRVRIRQVLLNLLENAVKHMGDGPEPRIAITASRKEGEVIIGVCDNGKGIPGDKLEAVFEPFSRLHGGSAPGLGIGLATVKRNVEAWGGEVWVESAPGEGACFYFTVPAAD